MRLLHVTHQYRPATGGSEQHISDLSEELVRRGHQVDVATTRSADVQSWRSTLPGDERLDGVNVHRHRALRRGRLGWYALRYGYVGRQILGGPAFDPLILLGNGPLSPGLAWRVLRQGPSYDVIHLQTLPYAHVIYGYVGARLARRPIVITPHLHVDQPEVFDLPVHNRVLRGADLVIADSEREVGYLAERGVARERIAVVGTGVKLAELPRRDQAECRARLGLPADALVLLYLGRKVQYKGIESILLAFGQLRERYPALYLVTAGPATEYSRALGQRFSSLPRWRDFDRVEPDQKVDLLNAADVLTLPSTGEAFGIVFLEAWAVQKPVIGARAGAIPWVIDDQVDGLLVQPGEPADLVRAVGALLENRETRDRMGRAGYQKVVQNFTVERVADKLEAAYRQVRASRASSTERTESVAHEGGGPER